MFDVNTFPEASSANISQVEPSASKPHHLRTILSVGAWFAIITGFVEAAGLELFQKINWANWGHTAHVSPKIFWVAPLWDLALFLPLTLTLILFGYAVPKLP